ncbi:MAG: hypothetical protein P9L92_13080 [Candidatus Electryonea clarkiae]|nr:hypothetical protein [Candidatus Electryonea clarkiae]MDP8286443.1 hypothetical protein [Candidatus Electryonea clarkiae]
MNKHDHIQSIWWKRELNAIIVIIISLHVFTTITFAESKNSESWNFVFKPNGQLWVRQYFKAQPRVHWDFGALIDFEIAQGRGHRIWFGGKYREAAGYLFDQVITPFDPRHIDSYQLLNWRWELTERREFFIHLKRFCYHEIDVHNPGAAWMTHAAFGFGTLCPAEEGEVAIRVYKSKDSAFDYYGSIGPFIHGGPSRIMGNTPAWQWESSTYLTLTYPIKPTLLSESSFRWQHLWLVKTAKEPNHDKLEIRQSIISQRESGGVAINISRIIHDDYPLRWDPVGWRLGLSFKF